MERMKRMKMEFPTRRAYLENPPTITIMEQVHWVHYVHHVHYVH